MSDLRNILQDIAARRDLTPEALVDEARAVDSPLHNRFEWDNTVAAERYRLSQAGELIRSVKIRFVAHDEPTEIREYHAVRSENTPTVYEPIEDIVLDDFKLKLLSQQFERDWKSFKARYDVLQDFAARIRGDLEAASAS